MILVLLSLCAVQAETSLAIRPEVITRFDPDGLGRARIVWSHSGAGPVQIRIGGPAGVALTGPEGPNGVAETGDWVTDGMVFVLLDEGGQELARATARVVCSPAGDTLYFPLQVGNEWVYRVNDRQSTSRYMVWRIPRAEVIGGKLWFVVAQTPAIAEFFRELQEPVTDEMRFRSDEQGRIYLLNARGAEQLWLD